MGHRAHLKPAGKDIMPAPRRSHVRQQRGAGISSSSSAVEEASWWADPEVRRRRRVAGYKWYTVESKVKASFRKGIRWIKTRCSELVHGR
ncbi:hypothetical protein ZIOFF_062432 [Zingiber officinale]|uniref:Uncharacterized protein n=1 Tax=Zingiber officinale TaxID=94328 RepID=A0A8J5F5E0_ZINOF|nr:hypothetical protein ZIOFF_062432 [Zingiber officinale]